jgi:hypothetical protein
MSEGRFIHNLQGLVSGFVMPFINTGLDPNDFLAWL